jgi:hypothetical protein
LGQDGPLLYCARFCFSSAAFGAIAYLYNSDTPDGSFNQGNC